MKSRLTMACLLFVLSALLLPGCEQTSAESAGRNPARGPTFVAAPGSPIAVGPGVGKLTAADLNGDGNLDLVLTCGAEAQGKPDAGKGFVALLTGDGRGAFQPVRPLLPFADGGLQAAAGDLNGDRRPDLAVVAHDSYTVTLLLQDDRGRFRPDAKRTFPASQGTKPHTHGVALADVNGDGRLDVLTTNVDDDAVSVLLGDGAGGLAPAKSSPFPAGRQPYEGLSVGDVNGDKRPDVVVPNLDGKAVSVLLGAGGGAFAPAPGSPFAVGDRPGYVALGDLNGDAALDVVVTHDDDPVVHVLLGDGPGGFRPAGGSPLRLKETVWGAAVADFNADGKNDVLLGARRGHVFLFLGDGRGGFERDPVLVPVGGKGSGYVAASDLNRDGKLDLVTSNFESGDVSVLLQK
jgi:hypothetical protein